jgi:predicted RNase H-like HicB family nuclease
MVAAMNVYKVEIERDGRWWAISVPQLPGVFSQARRRANVDSLAREAIALYLDIPQDSFEITVVEVTAADEAAATA